MRTKAGRPTLDVEQVLFFRDRRSHLAGPGATDAAAAARAILGAQAQQEGPALFALSLRARTRPTAAGLKRLLTEAGRVRLVRTWGQRDTLHVYDPDDWPLVVAARKEWPQSGRRGAMPGEPDLREIRRLFEAADKPLFRRDLFDAIPQRFVDEVAAHPGVAATGSSAVRFAASRLIWRLALAGDICFAEKRGAEQSYAHRELWFPKLAWRKAAKDTRAAATALVRRYLAAHGPATAADLAHFFGAGVKSAREWLGRLESELVEVRCGARQGLFALRADLPELTKPAPSGASGWPPRLLPKWDTHLMRHADKDWIAPDEGERRLVWRKAADISATVLVRGRVVGVWSHKATRKKVTVRVQPLSGWRKSFLPAVRREVAAFAKHLEVTDFEVIL